jgi:hypothetical protein
MIGLTSLSACENNLLNETPISTLSSENSFKTIKDDKQL